MNIGRAWLALVVGLLAGEGTAETLPAYYPETFQRAGVVDRVDYTQREIVINDTLYHLSDSVAVHSPFEKNDTVYALQRGRRIGFSFLRDQRRRMVTEAWVLPSSHGQSAE